MDNNKASVLFTYSRNGKKYTTPSVIWACTRTDSNEIGRETITKKKNGIGYITQTTTIILDESSDVSVGDIIKL